MNPFYSLFLNSYSFSFIPIIIKAEAQSKLNVYWRYVIILGKDCKGKGQFMTAYVANNNYAQKNNNIDLKAGVIF